MASDLNLLINKQFLGNLSVSLVQTGVMKRDTKRQSQLQIIIFHCLDQRFHLRRKFGREAEKKVTCYSNYT